ncbi:undecaprenyl-diphosphate phosphatase [Candidatus Aerophobetes bacterium]|nr:undecaprenyl-diphosphate phosphatase [Candidatus Aerophobetes bacterium]
MNVTHSLVLGILQGFTEFLPISSSGHLVILQHYMGIKESVVFFNVMVHIGTLASVVVFFRKELYLIVLSVVKFSSRDKEYLFYRQIILAVLIGTLPTAFSGFILSKVKDFLFYGAVLPAGMLLFTGFFLWLGEKLSSNMRIPEKKQKPGIIDALFIGFMQGVAIIPGISRSGTTISSGLIRGLGRKIAFRYSFLLFIPAAIGALVLESREVNVAVASAPTLPFFLGTSTAFITGIIALTILRKVLEEKKLVIFSWYCWILGGSILFFEAMKVLTSL